MSKIGYNKDFNRNNVFFRTLLVGALSSLNRFVMWENVRDKNERKDVQVPFYFSTTGDERFLQDTFMNDLDYDEKGCVAETFYNIIPRGIVTMEDIAIEEEALTNKFNRGTYLEETNDGELLQYTADFFNIPINVSLGVTGYFDSHLDMLKFTEGILRIFYKNIRYDFEYKNIRCVASLEFPADYTQERVVEFSFTDRKEWKVIFNLEIKSILPVAKEGTKMFAGNSIQEFPCRFFIGSSDEVEITTTNGEKIVYVLDKKGNLVPLQQD